MSDRDEFVRAMSASAELLQVEEYEQALNLVDSAIERAVNEGDNSWVRILCHHAANIAMFSGNPVRVRQYYEKSLANDPENPRALYGIAKFYLERGERGLAESYATRCHEAIARSDDPTACRSLQEMLSKRWPELGR
jgi:Tfp pilus assembly protein PilF